MSDFRQIDGRRDVALQLQQKASELFDCCQTAMGAHEVNQTQTSRMSVPHR